MADDTMDLQITRRRRQPLNQAGADIFKSRLMDRENALNTAKSIFDRQAVIDTGSPNGDSGEDSGSGGSHALLRRRDDIAP